MLIKLLFIFLLFALPCSASDSYRITLPNGLEIHAEEAKDKRKGLQGRENLCDRCGMVFIFEGEWFHGFWMKDTLIDLAIIWMNGDGKIVHIENAEPCLSTPCEIFVPDAPAKYVLEVNPEAATGLELGAKIKSKPPLF